MHRYNYIITIKEPDYKKADAVSWPMLLLATIFFSYTALKQWSSKVYHNVAILYAIIAAFIILWSLCNLVSSQKKDRIPFYRLALFAAAIGWFVEPVNNYWMAGLYVIAALLERQVKFPQEIGVDESGITFNTLPAKEYAWTDINNLLLKEGILTVDYKNNKIFQQEIESEVSAEMEKEFNGYCEARLSSFNVK